MRVSQFLTVILMVLILLCIVLLERSYEVQKSTNEQLQMIVTDLRLAPEPTLKDKHQAKKHDDAFMSDMGRM